MREDLFTAQRTIGELHTKIAGYLIFSCSPFWPELYTMSCFLKSISLKVVFVVTKLWCQQECIPVGCVPPPHWQYLRISLYSTHAPPRSNHTCPPPWSNHACPPPGATTHAPPPGATMHAPPRASTAPPPPPRTSTHAPQSNHACPPPRATTHAPSPCEQNDKQV